MRISTGFILSTQLPKWFVNNLRIKMKNILVMRDGQQWGPFTEEELKGYVAHGNFSAEDHAWREGMTEWTALRNILQLPAVPPPRAQLPPTPSPINQQLIYESRKKSAGLACFLNFILPGVGYMYAGRVLAGIFVLTFWAICIPLTFGVGSALIWIVGIIDGFIAVNRANQKLAAEVMSGRAV